MMHYAYTSIALPVTEYAQLQRLMLTMIGSRTALASILRRKLGSAKAVSPAAAGDVAVSGMRVGFRIDGERSDERILTWYPPRRNNAAHMSLLSARGLALLGLGPGESISYRTEGDRTEFLEVEHVSPVNDRTRSRLAAVLPPRDVLEVASIPFTAPQGAFAGGQNA